MKAIGKKEFETEIVKEYSCPPVLDELGRAKCKMEFFTDDSVTGEGCIIWSIEYLDRNGEIFNEDEVVIGIWFENKILTDYDGLFNLPKEAKELLRESGITVPKEFEE